MGADTDADVDAAAAADATAATASASPASSMSMLSVGREEKMGEGPRRPAGVRDGSELPDSSGKSYRDESVVPCSAERIDVFICGVVACSEKETRQIVRLGLSLSLSVERGHWGPCVACPDVSLDKSELCCKSRLYQTTP